MEKWTSGAAYDQWMGRWSRLLADEFLNWLSLPSHLRWLTCAAEAVSSQRALSTASRPLGLRVWMHLPIKLDLLASIAMVPWSASKPGMRWLFLSMKAASMLSSAVWG